MLMLAEVKLDMPGRQPEYVTLSTKDTVRTLCRELLAKLGLRTLEPYRIWKMPQGDYEGVQLSMDKFMSSGAELLEISDKTLEDAMIEFDDAFAIEYATEGKWMSDRFSITKELLDLQPLFSQENDFFSKLGSPSRATQQQKRQQTPPSSSSSFSKSKEITPFMSQGLSRMKVEPGTLGLGNLCVLEFVSSAVPDTYEGVTLAL